MSVVGVGERCLLVATTVIRVGALDTPYAVAVVTDGEALRTVRLAGDPDALPEPGTPVDLVAAGAADSTYHCRKVRQS